MKKLLVILACWVGVASAQTGTTPVVTNPTFYDDTNVHVPLQFGFPFFGRTFTNSWMHSNGVVSFLDPQAPLPNQQYNPGQWAYCCQGMDLVPNNPQLGPQFNYMIAPLWTDLYPAKDCHKAQFTSYRQSIQKALGHHQLCKMKLEIPDLDHISQENSILLSKSS